MTSNVWLTRGSIQGPYNAAVETGFSSTISPGGTLWATDINNPGQMIAATNYAALTFNPWTDAYGGLHQAGGNTVGRDAVVHLLGDDIFLNLKFTQFISGGDFAYQRSTPTGDYNGNGSVDAADYVVWRKDPNRTQPQYDVWRAHFGQPAGSGSGASANAAVPEPTTSLLLMFAAAGWCVRRRRAA